MKPAPLAQAAAQPASSSNVVGKTFYSFKIITIAFAHGANDMYMAFVSPLLPVLIQAFSLTKTAAGALAIFTQLPSLIQPFIGHWADRFNLKWAIILAPAVSGVLISLTGIAPGYATVAFLFLLAGVSNAAFHAVGPALAGHFAGDKLGRGMSYMLVGGEVGRILGAVVVVSVISVLTLRGLPWMMGVGFIATVILFFLMKDTTTLTRQSTEVSGIGNALKKLRPIILPLVVLSIVRNFMDAVMSTFLPTMLREEGSSLIFAGSAASIIGISGVCGALLGGPLSDRIGRRNMVLVSMIGSPIMMVVFLLVNGWLKMPSLLLMGLVFILATPPIMALVQETCPENRALVNGIYMALSFVIYSLDVLVVGRIGDFFDLRTAGFISVGVVLVGLPFVLLLPKKIQH